jgi:uridine kinase
MHYQFIEPMKNFADIIISGGGENQVGVEKVVAAIRKNFI